MVDMVVNEEGKRKGECNVYNNLVVVEKKSRVLKSLHASVLGVDHSTRSMVATTFAGQSIMQEQVDSTNLSIHVMSSSRISRGYR